MEETGLEGGQPPSQYVSAKSLALTTAPAVWAGVGCRADCQVWADQLWKAEGASWGCLQSCLPSLLPHHFCAYTICTLWDELHWPQTPPPSFTLSWPGSPPPHSERLVVGLGHPCSTSLKNSVVANRGLPLHHMGAWDLCLLPLAGGRQCLSVKTNSRSQKNKNKKVKIKSPNYQRPCLRIHYL